jgi:hypothetical protein
VLCIELEKQADGKSVLCCRKLCNNPAVRKTFYPTFWASVSFLPNRGGAGRFGSLFTSTSAPLQQSKRPNLHQ